LGQQEKGKGPGRNPGWYFFTFYGEPSETGTWGWRVDGHHLAINITIEKGKMKSAAPFFFGCNPAMEIEGAKKGFRLIPEVEEPARALYKMLDDHQRKLATRGEVIPEILENSKAPESGPAEGLLGEKLAPAQKAKLNELIMAYTNRMPTAVAAAEWARIKADGGLEKMQFHFAGSPEAGKPYTYRVFGPHFLVELLNVQKDAIGTVANHIHSVWRHNPKDFGLKA
jgi:hypothetical protein